MAGRAMARQKILLRSIIVPTTATIIIMDDNDEEHEFVGDMDDSNDEVDATNNNTTTATIPNSAAAKKSNNDTASSRHRRVDAPSTEGRGGPKSSSDSVVFSPELLSMYYSRLFPYDLLYSWLAYDPSSIHPTTGGKAFVTPSKQSMASYSGGTGGGAVTTTTTTTFPRREFSMTIEPTPGQEVYIRYQSFATRDDLASAVMKRRPTKIDIGAVFNYPPKDNKSLPTGKLKTIERELVFDIDLTDYDVVRNCGCDGAKICPKCWIYMGMAMEVMDSGLRSDFGFKHVAWFYSGRRGVHCWVCDDTARKMSNEARSAVASYFEVNLGSEKNKMSNLSSPLHPALARAYAILEPHFVNHVLPESGHALLATHASSIKLLETLPKSVSTVMINLERKWRENPCTPKEKWRELKSELSGFVSGRGGAAKAPKTLSATERVRIELWPIETVFKHTYPRLDINVSKMQNHLLKSPFCVHPKTGRVCVPIETSNFSTFDPFSVPTLAQLMKELDQYKLSFEGDEGKEKDEGIVHDWQKTSLRGSFEYFQKKFLVPLLNEERKVLREERERRAALVGDF